MQKKPSLSGILKLIIIVTDIKLKSAATSKKTAMLFKKQKIKEQKGQVAVFLLMIFQVLFVLFAMTINIALTVHDKINLQNSVDLAALYGAKKQAEVLNAIAHINFQIRQSYKLLAWRFRVLSTVTVKNNPPQFIGGEWCPQNRHNTLSTSCDSRYASCFSADLWERGIKPNNQNICLNNQVTVPTIPSLPIIADFIQVNLMASQRQITLRNDLTQSCNAESFINWLMTQVFLSQFRLDQKDRKMMIHAIYKASLKQGLDLKGENIKDGVERTFKSNLTRANSQTNINFQVFNPLEGKNITDFLEREDIFPILEFLYFGDINGSGDECSHTTQTFSNQNLYPNAFTLDDPIVQQYRPYADQWKELFKFNQFTSSTEQFITPLTLSYSKKSDFTIYYGVSVKLIQSTPQLFAPSSSLVLTASAFAKPFGGRIGPPAGKDSLAIELKPNYTRYPGDPYGLRDRKAHYEYYLVKHEGKLDKSSWKFFSVNHYTDLTIGDALATNGDPDFALRLMELTAISPNVFELLNYSISNNYMQTYFTKICNLIGSGADCSSSVEGITTDVGSPVPGFARGDFGHPYSDHYNAQNESIRRVSSFVPFYFFTRAELELSRASPSGFEEYAHKRTPPYLIKDPAHFLTGFMPTTHRDRYEDYNIPGPQAFMRCYKPTQSGKHIPSGCAVGGRSGYSVKLISCETVNNQPGLKPINLNPDYCE